MENCGYNRCQFSLINMNVKNKACKKQRTRRGKELRISRYKVDCPDILSITSGAEIKGKNIYYWGYKSDR